MTDSERNTIERSLIGAILIDAERCLPMAINGGVAADWFVSPTMGLAWTAARRLFAERKGVDVTTVVAKARQIAAEPHSPFAEAAGEVLRELGVAMEETATTAHFESYLELGRNAVMLRRVGAAQRQYSKDLAEGADVEFAIGNFNRRILKIMSCAMGARAISLRDELRKIEEKYLQAHQKRIVEGDLEYTPGIPLPWKPVNVSSQGVQEGLYYLGARPSVGKTAFMLNLVRFWCERGVKVAFNSLDMAIAPMLKRPIGEVSRVSFAKASFGTTNNADLQAMHAAIYGETDAAGNVIRKGIADWPLTLIQERDVDAFRSWCIAMRNTGHLDVVVIDFVQLMGTRARYNNDNEKLEYISGVLKSVAIDLNIPVIALSQLNRACEEDGGRVPTASDLRGSGALEQDATAVWILHNDREVAKAWNTPDATGGYSRRPLGLTMNEDNAEFVGISPVRFILAKNQNGRAGAEVWYPFVFFKKYCLFMLGDSAAHCPVAQVGYGVSAKNVTDYSPMYASVTHDWRNDPYEIKLREHGCLIGYDLRKGEAL